MSEVPLYFKGPPPPHPFAFGSSRRVRWGLVALPHKTATHLALMWHDSTDGIDTVICTETASAFDAGTQDTNAHQM